ncbi:MAG: M50 family metallopeptidase [Firmicutes bacterium]|nr:M50 family metallopeptidase [Bacillota bacterium]
MISCILSVGSVFARLGYIALAILVLLLMITIHEFGHYTAGKILKFKINEFSIGFGKALFTKTKKNGEVFSIRLVPLGGYCAFDGEDTNNETDGSFNAQKPWKRLIVLFCGAFFNFLSAIIFSVVLLAVIGNGQVMVNNIEGVNNSVDRLQVGDIITHCNDEKISFFNPIGNITQNFDIGEDIKMTIIRNGEKKEIVVQKYSTVQEGKEVGIIGMQNSYVRLSFGNALLQAVPFTFEMAWQCLVILGQLLVGKYGLKDFGGPITTIGYIADAGAISMYNLLLLIPLIAVNLAVFNLLPIPALDGAKMVFVLIEWIRGKPINRDVENKIHTVGLILLFAFVVIVDFIHLIG